MLPMMKKRKLKNIIKSTIKSLKLILFFDQCKRPKNDIQILLKKHYFYISKQAIDIDDVNIDNMLVSNNILSLKKKCFFGYVNNLKDDIQPLFVKLPRLIEQ